MALPWFRMYAEFAGDPVVQSLSFDDQRHYIILLCLKCSGLLDRSISPASRRDLIIARGMGLDASSSSEAKRRLQEVGLIDKNWQPTAWDKRQFVSDVSTDRVRKHRNNKETGNGNETPSGRSGNNPDYICSVSVSESDLETSRFIFNLIRALNPKQREPNFNAWANDIRLMRERDHHSDEEIRSLFEWANADIFWKTNVLSPATLRKQWDRLIIKRQHGEKPNATDKRIDNDAVSRVRRANGLDAPDAIPGTARRID